MNVAIEVPGVLVGHWTSAANNTGCTVVRFPDGTVASGEVRGGAPATREFALLEPTAMMERLDAVVLSGGSAFGLAAADGVSAALAAEGVGFPTGAGPVPIVVGLSLFDLRPDADPPVVPPDADAGAAALDTAAPTAEVGRVGAGTGATTNKWTSLDDWEDGGLGIASMAAEGCIVTAVCAVNAAGQIGGSAPDAIRAGEFDRWAGEDTRPFQAENTTIGVVVTNAKLSKVECFHVAQSGHDGLARAIFPSHLASDGDAIVGAATGEVAADIRVVRSLAILAVEEAVRRAPTPAD